MIKIDWNKLLGLILKCEYYSKKILYILENHIFIVFDDDERIKTKYQWHIDNHKQAIYVMLASISCELQR
jgi:hypothetical protein